MNWAAIFVRSIEFRQDGLLYRGYNQKYIHYHFPTFEKFRNISYNDYMLALVVL